MTNVPNYSPKPPSGGMPKWLIILLVILLFIILGCCGGVAMCFHYGGKVAEFGAEKAKEQLNKSIAEEKQRMQDAATRQAEELKHSREIALPPNENGTTNNTPGNTTPPAGVKPEGGVTVPEKMPGNFPADVPVYAGTTPTGAMADKIHGAGTVTLESTDTVDTISAYYEKQMAANGWTIDSNLTIGGNCFQGYSKDTRKTAITIVAENGKSHISILYGPK